MAIESETIKVMATDPVLFRAVAAERVRHLRALASFAFRKGCDSEAERFRAEANALLAGVRDLRVPEED